MNRISALIRRDPRKLLAPFAMSGYSENMATSEGRVSSPDTESASALIMYFPGCRMVRNKFVLFASYPFYDILL